MTNSLHSPLPIAHEPSLVRLSCRDSISSMAWRCKRWLRWISQFKPIMVGVLVHLCIGSPYGWTTVAPLLARRIGIITSAPQGEWTLKQCTVFLSLAFTTHDIGQGLNANLSRYLGVRQSLIIGAGLTFLAWFLIGLGPFLDLLPLLWIGFMMLGIGMSFCYLPVLQNAVAKHPDIEGVVSGLIIGGIGASPILFTLLFEASVRNAVILPNAISQDELELNHPGEMFLKSSPADLAVLPYHVPILDDRWGYEPHTGWNGLSTSLWSVGILYGITIFLCGYYSIDHQSVLPFTPLGRCKLLQDRPFIALALLKGVASVSITAILGTSKSVLAEEFSEILPNIVDNTFTRTYLGVLTLTGLMGRIVLSLLTDKLGPQVVFFLIGGLGTTAYSLLPFLIWIIRHEPSESSAILTLFAFILCNMIGVFVASGTFTSLVGYCSSIYGRSRIHEVIGFITLCTCWTPFLGPFLFLTLREWSNIGLEYLNLAGLHLIGLVLNMVVVRNAVFKIEEDNSKSQSGSGSWIQAAQKSGRPKSYPERQKSNAPTITSAPIELGSILMPSESCHNPRLGVSRSQSVSFTRIREYTYEGLFESSPSVDLLRSTWGALSLFRGSATSLGGQIERGDSPTGKTKSMSLREEGLPETRSPPCDGSILKSPYKKS